MTYNYYFDIAALVLNIVLILLACLRRSYPSPRVRVYRLMLFMHLAATVFDLLTVDAIVNPANHSMAYNYGINMAYYIANCLTAFVFVWYGLVFEKQYQKPRRTYIIWYLAAAAEIILIITTPLTHLVFYYDDALVYLHGPMLIPFYAVAIVCLLYVLYLKLSAHERKSTFQTVANIYYILSMLAVFAVTLFRPDLLIMLFVIDVGFFVMYAAQDNPDTRIYKKLGVFNRYAFDETLYGLILKKSHFSVVVFTPRDGALYCQTHSRGQVFSLEKQIIGSCRRHLRLGNSLYALSDLCFAAVCRQNGDPEQLIFALKQLFCTPIPVDNVRVDVSMSFAVMRHPGIFREYTEAEQVTDDIISRIRHHHGEQVLAADRSGIAKEREQENVRAIKRAIASRTFTVEYQPIFTCGSDRCFNAEAIVKLSGDCGRLIDSGEFIPAAIKNGLLEDLADVIILRVCDFIKRSDVLGLGVTSIDINIPLLMMLDECLPARLIALADRYSIPTNRICFEFTDSATVESKSVIEENIVKIRSLGFHFALDHFGINYTNLPYLVSLPFEVVKIDSAVLRASVSGGSDSGLFRNTVQLIKGAGKNAACDGAATGEEAALIRSAGCDFVQGGYYKAPMSEEDFIKFLHDQLVNILQDVNG